MTDTPNRPEWWADYEGYTASQEMQHDGQDAAIHQDGFAAGWTIGCEAGRESLAETTPAIVDANLRMQRELFRLTAERDRAVDRYQLAEDRIDDLEGLIRAYRNAWAGLARYHDLPDLTDDELMDDTIREQRDADRDAAYDTVKRCREELLKAEGSTP